MSMSTIFKTLLVIMLAGLGPFLSVMPFGKPAVFAAIPNIDPLVSDFAISASPNSTSLAVGSSTTVTIVVTSLGGFSGKVLLSVSSYLVDATLDKTNVTLSSGGTESASLSLFAPDTTSPDLYIVSISGSYGCSQQHTTYVAVTITGPDFTVTAVKTLLTAPPGGSDSTGIDLTSKNGFSGTLLLYAFSSAGLPVLTPPSVSLTPGGTGTSTLTIPVDGATQPGNYTIEVAASSGSLFRTVEIDLVVAGPGFVLSSSLFSLTVIAGGASNSSIITLSPFGGFAGPVILTDSSYPSGLLTLLIPTILVTTGSSTLTVSAPSGATIGFYFVTVTGNNTSTGFIAFTDIFVTVKGPDFELSSNPEFLSLTAGGTSCTSLITVTSLLGFSGAITLTNSSSPAGLSLSLSSTSIPGSGTSTLNVTAPSGTIPGFYFISIIGTSGSLSRFADVFVEVTGPDFSLSASPSSATLTAPATGTNTTTSTISITSLNGFSGSVTLDAIAFGYNMSATISPSPVTAPGTATLTIGVGSAAYSGIYTVYVIGTSGLLVHPVFVSVTVIAPDFSISSSSTTLSIDTVSPGTSTITISPLNGFTDTVTLTAYPSSFNLNASISPDTISTSGTAILSVNSTVPGTYSVDVFGFTGVLTHYLTISVTVIGPDFSLSATPSSLTIQEGSNSSSIITLTPLNGFSGTVSLTAIPSTLDLVTSFNVSTITSSAGAELILSVATDTIPGTYSVEVEGTSGLLSHTVTVTINVSSFTITPTPASLTIDQGTSSSTVLSVSPVNGFTGSVGLTASTPAGLPSTLNTTTVSGSGHVLVTISASISIAPGAYLVNVTGTSGSLTKTATITVTVPVPDFSIMASTPVSVIAGVTGNSTVSIGSIAGFTDTVSLSSTMSPSTGLACALSPATVTGGSGTSTLSCSGTTGNYNVTVTGTSTSAGPHTTVVTFKITDFTISAGPVSPSQKSPGLTGTSTITLTGINGFTGTVDLSVSASTPAGLTCSPLAPAVFGASPQSKTLSCSALTAGDYTVSVTGSVGTVSHFTGSILFHVTDFTITAGSVTPATVTAGSTAISTISSGGINGFTGTVTLTASASTPTGLSCSLSPTTVTFGTTPQTSTLSCSATAYGNYTVTVTGTAGSLTHTTASILFRVSDFTMTASPTSVLVTSGGTGTSDVTVTFRNGFIGTVTLTSTVSPSTGLACSLGTSSLSVSNSSSLSCLASANGSFTVTVTGTSGSIVHTATVAVTVTDFTVNASPTSVNALAGAAATSTITVAPVSGFTGTVALTSSVSPAGLSCTSSPTSIVLGASQTSTLSCSGPTGTYTVIVTGTSGSLTLTATVTYTITDYTVTASPASVSALAGAAATSTITVGPVNGFTGTVALTSTVSPAGLTCTLTPTSVVLGAAQTSALSCSGPAGTYTVTVTGTSGSLSHSATVTVTVTDFTVTASPTSVSTNSGTAVTSTITVAPVNGFTGTVALTSTVSPAGLTCTLTPTSIVLGASGTSTLSCTGPAGVYTVTVTGTSGALSHSATVTVTVMDFTVTASPASVSVNVGTAATSTITVASVNGFTGTVTLTTTSSVSGLTASLGTSSISGGSGTTTLTINADSTLAVGTYTVTVQGTSGSLSHQAQVSITVTNASGSSFLGLPATTLYALTGIIIVAIGGAALYFLRFRKKTKK